ncbi:hypothetical protein RSAG8_01274, partial [Rhizoctonia solani AG-8 WAC10335]
MNNSIVNHVSAPHHTHSLSGRRKHYTKQLVDRRVPI